MTISRTRLVIEVALVGFVAIATMAAGLGAPELRTPTPPPSEGGAYGTLANGNPVMVLGDRLFYVGQQGVRSLCPDGIFRLKSGGTLTVRRGKIVSPEDITPPWVIKGLNPQPEPPIPELFGTLIDGREVVTSRGKLYFLRTGGRRVVCPNGEYSVRGGNGLEVRAGMIVNPAQLGGLAPR